MRGPGNGGLNFIGGYQRQIELGKLAVAAARTSKMVLMRLEMDRIFKTIECLPNDLWAKT
jgi:hypothetical protein